VDLERDRFVCEAVTTSLPTNVGVGYSRPLGSGVVGKVATTLEPLVIDDVRSHESYIDTSPGVRSEICVPVQHKGRLVGILNVESTTPAAFHHELPLLQTVAEQVAGAILNARLYEELKTRARLMEMMSEVSRTALEATRLDDFLSRVAHYVYDHFPLEIAAIRLLDSAAGEYVRAADAGVTSQRPGARWPLSTGIIGRCLRTGEMQLVRDVRADGEYELSSASVGAELVVPIRLHGEILGALNMESSTDIFDSATITAFQSFADQIAGALKIFRINDELTTAKATLEQEKRNAELANANLTQVVEKLNDVTAHDSLTGIHSRRHFDHVLKIEWRRAARTGRPISLLIGDIDAFKPYNDRYGHLVGDECIKKVAETIRHTVNRAADVVARYGGEEFAVLLPDTENESAVAVAETIRKRVRELCIPHGASPTGPYLTITFGVATARADGDEARSTELVRAADRALYAGKNQGRNRVVADTQVVEPGVRPRQ
jgi:diguanylate cyclase (GGDEF)-like protein